MSIPANLKVHNGELFEDEVSEKGKVIDAIVPPPDEIEPTKSNESESKAVRAMPITRHYHPEVLNTDTPTKRIISALSRFFTESENSFKEENIGMNILFYGLPGTGKTEFAKYIGNLFNRLLLIKRYSDLESPLVGGTEINIALAFRHAEKTDQILFIDEADSFFTDRNDARASWEVSRTNEMLTQMDNFRGVFICCTNLKRLLDDAVLRRFSFKIEFKPLRIDDRVRLVEDFFKDRLPLSDELKRRVESLDLLTPGDIRAVHNSFRYESESTIDEIITELEREVQHKKRDSLPTIGF